MIGTRIESRSGSWLFLACTLAATLFCLGMAVAQSEAGWLVAAVLPALLTVVLFLDRRALFEATVVEGGLQFDATGETLPFDQIDLLVAPYNGRRRFPMMLIVGQRKIDIPPRLNLPSSEVRELLLSVIPQRERLPADPQIAAFFLAQRERFGQDKVWHAAGRSSRYQPRGPRTSLWVLLALFVASFVYVAYGSEAKRDALVGLGGAGLLVSILGLLILLAQASTRKNARSKAEFSLVISPVGLALHQAELKGELRWDEIRSVRLRERPGHFALSREDIAAAIDLQVAGAVIKILDVYDQPLDLIHERIAGNWQAPA